MGSAEEIDGAARRSEKRLGGIEKELRQLGRLIREPATVREPLIMAEQAVDAVAALDVDQIICGPWTGEVGFELLYWIPFLNWAVERRPELADRLAVISRGGAEPWYWHLADAYTDAFEQLTPEEFLARRGERMKQVETTDLERELIAGARGRLGADRYATFHPSAMYASMLKLAAQDSILRFLDMARPKALVRPGREPLADVLPESYVAVRFYFSAPFPDTPDNRAFVAGLLRRLTERTAVVLLNTGIKLDDHVDLSAADQSQVVTLEHLMHPVNNLALQSIAIANAEAFVGTYGGLSYLPCFYGVPSVSFYSELSFIRRHLDLAGAIFQDQAFGSYLPLATRDVAALDLVL